MVNGKGREQMGITRGVSCCRCLLLFRPSQPPAAGKPWLPAPAASHEPAHLQLALLALLLALLLLHLTCLQGRCCERQGQVRGSGHLSEMSAAGGVLPGWQPRLLQQLCQQQALAGCSAAAAAASLHLVACCGKSWQAWRLLLLVQAAARRWPGCLTCCLTSLL
jgi:hypothetical protein